MQNIKNKKRPPVIALLGHVDHGKTSLLDNLRKTSVQLKETGGITQKIGASVVTTKEGRKITFIDTPGHAAFTSMRSQGASASDIILLIVSSEDGVKPQTREAIEIIKKSQLPFILVITKVDLKTANPESVKSQIEKEGIALEGRGGSVPVVCISAKTGEGIDELLDIITLLGDVSDLKGDDNSPTQAVVIETSQSKGGLAASVVVKDGTLEIGKTYYVGNLQFKIRSMVNESSEKLKIVHPGEPAQILGFSTLPKVGDLITQEGLNVGGTNDKKPVTYKNDGGLNVLIKTLTLGSLDAVRNGLPDDLSIISFGVGSLNENDVFIAKSSDALIFTFETKTPQSVLKLAENEGVKVYQFDIIYKLFEKIDEILKSREKILVCKAEIIAIFPFNNKKIAGCKIIEGKIKINDKPSLVSKEKSKGIVRVVSLRKNREEIQEATQGMECGILFSPQLDFEIGDMLILVSNN